MPKTEPNDALLTTRLTLSRWWLLIPLTSCLLIITGSLVYLSHSYDELKSWYLGLSPCIYKGWEWSTTFFTPKVHAAGNRYAVAGLIGAALMFGFYTRLLINKKGDYQRLFRLYRSDAIYISALLIFGLLIWLYGLLKVYPAYDEVFSAVNCAGIHPFQTASYYMLPNNHIFFNIANSILGAYTPDKLFSGRLISGAAFALLIPLLYYWIRGRTGSRVFAAIFCALMMLQFPVWGFSFQGRGYSIYLLCAWTSFIGLQHYIRTGSRPALAVHAIAVVVGFWTIPSFLFWEAALALYLLFHMLRQRKVDWPAIRAQILAGVWVFLVFLPLLCFSGKAALMENRYVRADKVSLIEYWPAFRMSFRSTIQYCFSGFVDAHNWSYLILFFIPLALLPFIRRSRIAGSVGFYAIMWAVFILMQFYFQRFPFMRNLTAHYSLTLAALLLSCYALMKILLRERWRLAQIALTAAACIAFAIHFIRFNRDHIHDSLYFYNADTRYRTLHDAVMTLPSEANVGVSDEGFYWEYLCQQRGLRASMCAGPTATHYIKMETEVLPPALSGHVEKIKQADEYEIYRIK